MDLYEKNKQRLAGKGSVHDLLRTSKITVRVKLHVIVRPGVLNLLVPKALLSML